MTQQFHTLICLNIIFLPLIDLTLLMWFYNYYSFTPLHKNYTLFSLKPLFSNAVPSCPYVDRTGCHMHDWSARQCNKYLGYTRRVTHQMGIVQITIFVNLQGTVYRSMYESSTTTGHSSLTRRISPTILFRRCQPSGIGDNQERPAGVNLKKISLHLNGLSAKSVLAEKNL